MANDTVSGVGGAFQGLDNFGNKSATRGTEVSERMKSVLQNNANSTMHLSGAQRVSAQAGHTCYIYNVSPVFQHSRRVEGFGTFLIPRAPKVGSKIVDNVTKDTRKATAEDVAGDYKLSKPIIINHSYVRSFQSFQEGKRTPYIEYGEDIAEDLVGCSAKYPPDLVSTGNQWDKNLLTWGVFITKDVPFEQLPADQQNDLMNAAQTAHIQRCQEKVNKGDVLFSQYMTKGKGGPLAIHRDCALFLGEVFGQEYNANRQWVTNSNAAAQLTGKIDCPFCGSKVKATVAKCPVCVSIIDPDRYEKLTAKSDKKKKTDKTEQAE